MTDLAELDRPADAAEKQSRAERISAEAAAIEDGIYFGLPMDVYQAVPRLGAGGIQDLCVSPATFWRGSWLDPERPEPDEEEAKHLKIGRAYHCARLEPHLFEQQFCREPCRGDFADLAAAKGACWNGKEIEAQLAALGQAKKAAADAEVADQGRRLAGAGFEGVIWPLVQAEFWEGVEAADPPKTVIPAKVWDEIVRDMDRLRGSPEVAEKLSGGEAEVSVFWTDRHGLKRKARFDYLTLAHWADIKTFDNTRGKRLEQAIADAIRFNRYHVTAAVYREASEAVRTGKVQIRGEASAAQRKLVAELQIKPEPQDCWFIFQEKNGVPNLLARRFTFFDVPIDTRLKEIGAEPEAVERMRDLTRRPTQIYSLALAEIDHALRQFVLYSEVYRAGQPWAPIDPVGEISDLDFSTYWLEGRQ